MVAESLLSTLFPKARRMVLGLLMSHPDRSFYLREIAEITGLGVGHVQRELSRLAKSGILNRFRRGRHVYFQADPACPIFSELRGIVIKTVGLADLLQQALSPIRNRIQFAFIFGSLARMEEHSASDVDLMVIGSVSLADVVDVTRDVEQAIGRPLNSTVYPPAEFSSKLAAGHHFVTKVATGAKLMLIGDESDLAALSAK